MAIMKYVDNVSGQEMYRVRIRRSSATQPGVAIDKRAQGFKTRAEAEKAEKKLFIQVERELMVAEQKSALFGTIVDEWELAAKKGDIFIRKLGAQTINDYVYIVRTHCSEWMNLHVTEIDRARAWMTLDKVERELSIARRKRLRSAIDGMLNWGILSGRIKGMSGLPTDGFKTMNKEEDKLPEILTLEQIRTLLLYAERVSHPWYPIWAMALFTGMRSGELLALRWDNVDFENQAINVHENFNNRTGIGPTKGRYWRTVPIESSQVLGLLKELKVKQAGERYVLPQFNLWKKGEQAKVLREFCVGSGLPSIRFHTLRACFATQLIRDGVAPAVVMKICGWRDLKTMQRYIRLAGIEVKGATQGLKLLPEKEAMGRVIELFKQD